MNKNTKQDEFLRKRAARQRKIKRRRLKIFFVSFILFTLAIAVILCLTVFFPINTITVKGSKIYSEKEILKASGITVGDNIFTTSQNVVTKRLKSKLPYIEYAELVRDLQGTLTVVVKDAEEYACYFDGKAYYTVSKSGWVMKKNNLPPEGIFTVSGCKVKCKVGNEIEFEDTEKVLIKEEIINNLLEEKVAVNSIDIKNTLSISLLVEGRFEVNLGNANFIPEKIRHLAAMINNIDENKSGKINLSMWTNDNTEATFIEQTNE